MKNIILALTVLFTLAFMGCNSKPEVSETPKNMTEYFEPDYATNLAEHYQWRVGKLAAIQKKLGTEVDTIVHKFRVNVKGTEICFMAVNDTGYFSLSMPRSDGSSGELFHFNKRKKTGAYYPNPIDLQPVSFESFNSHIELLMNEYEAQNKVPRVKH